MNTYEEIKWVVVGLRGENIERIEHIKKTKNCLDAWRWNWGGCTGRDKDRLR